MTDALDVAGVRALLAELVPELRARRTQLKPVVVQLKAESKVFAPKGATPEHRYLEGLTHTPWGSKVATTYAQELSVQGYLTPQSLPGQNDPAWQAWVQARMPLIEDILIRESFQYGDAYVAALTTRSGQGAIAKPLPPYHTAAIYDDPVIDVWPRAVLSTTADRKRGKPVPGTIYAGRHVYNVEFPEGLDAETAIVKDSWVHRSNQTPVIRLINEIDSQGNTVGKIEPLLPLLERIRKDTYDRVLIQHKSSWKVRTISGLELPSENPTEQELAREKLRLSVEDILVSSNPEAKFGTLDESPLGDLIKAKESDIYEMCAIAPIPPSALMPGNVSNVSAEAIAELRNGFENRVADHKEVLGEAFGWLIRTLAIQAGQAVDVSNGAEIRWQDRSVRSLAQAADAWSKIAPALDIPKQAVWHKLPGVTQGEIEQWAAMANRAQGARTLEAIFARQQQPTTEPEDGGTA